MIIPTYNRREELGPLLESLAVQTCPREQFEIVVVDDGSTDGTQEMVRRFTQTHDLSVHYIHQANAGPGPSRNLGMEYAQGDVFVFVDSDCTVPPEWVARIIAAMATGEVDAFGGPDRALPTFPPLLKAVDYTMTSFMG